jgi:phenylacetate-CoA ligase
MSDALRAALGEYTGALAPALAATLGRAAACVPAFAARLAEAGLADPVPENAEDLARLPVLGKDELIDRQLADPPWGGLLDPTATVLRIFQSPGPLYEPQLAGPDPWRWGQALRSIGVGRGDRVLNCFGYHLSPAGAMFDEACLALGASVVPGGIGNTDLQARAVADTGVTAYIGLPSYLKTLVERFDALGPAPQTWQVSKALVTAEPLPDSLRSVLRARVADVRAAYGTAEAGLIGYETEAGGGLMPADGVLIQVCDLDDGRPLVDGEGQVVVTLLRPDYPVVRFGTGDLSAWMLSRDGRLRLAGVLGRVGQAVKVRGMFLHPRQAQAALQGIDGVQAWQFVVDRVDHRDELRCLVVAAPGADADLVRAAVGERIRTGLRFSCQVESVGAVPDDAVIKDVRNWS